MTQRGALAERLRQNWSALHPDESPCQSEAIDDSLTNLSWLQNLNILKISPGRGGGISPPIRPAGSPVALRPLASSSPVGTSAPNRPMGSATIMLLQPRPSLYNHQQSVQLIVQRQPTQQPQQPQQQQQQQQQQLKQYNCSKIQVDPNDILDMSRIQPTKSESPTSASSRTRLLLEDRTFLAQTQAGPLSGGRRRGSEDFMEALGSVDPGSAERYRTNAAVKPPFSFAALICMAMREAPQGRISLGGINAWIADNFPYYREADPGWQVSGGGLTV